MMGVITINSSIFPRVMSISFGEPGSSECQSIDLPRGANLLYLQNIEDLKEIKLLKKFVNKEDFSDEDYEMLFNLFLTNTPRLNPPTGNVGDFLQQFGVYAEKTDGKFEFQLITEHTEQIKVDTWDYITVDLLKDTYTDIINCFDFGDIDIYLGGWKSDIDAQKQSLLTAFRSAFMFTLIGFLYGDDRALYTHFNDFFENEFYKRIAFINGIWVHRKDDNPIKYIPIFDSFYNLHGNCPAELIQIIHSILADENIVQDERLMIKNRLVEGAMDLHSNTDPQSMALEQAIVKPVVNYLIEIQSADGNLAAAKTLFEENLYEPSINRSYYAMMHGLKALLENKQQLSEWEPGKLNVNASHKVLEQKLIALSSQGIIINRFVSDFQYVKQKRWIADYNVVAFSKAECHECIIKAQDFITEVKRISL